MTAKIWPPRQDDPPQLSSPPAWTEFALCAQADPEAWFVEQGESTRPAKAVCRACPVREPCLAGAIDRSERWGVWGGLSRPQRLRAARQIASGRTVADIIAADDARFYAQQEALDASKAATEERRLADQRDKRAALKDAMELGAAA